MKGRSGQLGSISPYMVSVGSRRANPPMMYDASRMSDVMTVTLRMSIAIM